MTRSSRTAARSDCSPWSHSKPMNTTRSTTANTTDAARAARTNRIQPSPEYATWNTAAASNAAIMRLPELYAMRQKARWRQCTMSSGPQSNATSTGPSSSAESANPTIAATSTAASAVADHSLGKNASWLRLSATSAPSNSTGHTDGNGEPDTATATAAIAADREDRPRVPTHAARSDPAWHIHRDIEAPRRLRHRAIPVWHDRRRPATRCDGRCPSPSRSPAAPSAAPSPLVRATRRRPCSAPTLDGRAQGCR